MIGGARAAEASTPEQFDAAFGPFVRCVLALPYLADVIRARDVAR